MGAEGCPKRHESFAIEAFDEEVILYNMATEKIIHCNATAALIWGLCDGSRTNSEIAKILQAAYPTTPLVLNDVTAVIEELTSEKALVAE